MKASEARQNFSELIGRVHHDGETVILESPNGPVAVMVPLDMYRRWMERREAHFARLEKIISERGPVDYSEEEVDADIAEALAAVRRQNAGECLITACISALCCSQRRARSGPGDLADRSTSMEGR